MKKFEVSNGMSTADSVALFLKGNKKGFKATRLEDGTITTEEIELEVEKKPLIILFKIIFYGFFFRVVFFSWLNLNNWTYHIPTIVYGFLFVMVIFTISRNKRIRMHHGAEHKVVNWCNKNNLTTYNAYKLNVENVRSYIRIHKSCGTNLFATYFTFYLVSSISFSCFGVRIPELITVLAPLFLYSTFPFNILGLIAQFITTAEPQKEHIEVAIAAMMKNIENERKREEQKEAALKIMAECLLKTK